MHTSSAPLDPRALVLVLAYVQEPLDVALKGPAADAHPDTLMMCVRVTRRRLAALHGAGPAVLANERRARAWVAEQRAPFRHVQEAA